MSNSSEVPEVYLQEFRSTEGSFEDLTSLAHLAGSGTLRLNFTGIHYVNSAHLGKLLALRKKVILQGGQITLCNLAPAVHEVLLAFAFDRLFHIDQSDAAE